MFYILMNLCSIGLAFFLAALAGGNAELASAFIAPAAIILLFTGGFYINTDSIPGWITWVRYEPATRSDLLTYYILFYLKFYSKTLSSKFCFIT